MTTAICHTVAQDININQLRTKTKNIKISTFNKEMLSSSYCLAFALKVGESDLN